MQEIIDGAIKDMGKVSNDPDFYAAKKLLRKSLPNAQMIELVANTATVVIDGEAQKFKI